MESSPAAAFIMSQPHFLFERFVVSLDDLAMFGEPHQHRPSALRRQSGQPVFGGLCIAFRPFHQRPFFRVRPAAQGIPVSRSNANGGKTRFPFMPGPLPPGDGFPHRYRQGKSQLFHRQRTMFRVPIKPFGWTSLSRPSRLRLGRLARLPDGHVLVPAHRTAQMQCCGAFPKLAVVPVGGIRHYRRRGDSLLQRLANLREGNGALRWKRCPGGLPSRQVFGPVLQQIQNSFPAGPPVHSTGEPPRPNAFLSSGSRRRPQSRLSPGRPASSR